MLEILYQDEYIVAINKPHDLLVHPSPIARDAEEFALQLLRDQLGQYVYPAHRLDRKTAGALLFSLDKETDRLLKQQFQNKEIEKTYWAILRGYAPKEMTIDYPLRKENGKLQESVTHFTSLEEFEINLAHGKHATSRYTLIEATPETGRMHQLRKHFAHILHPIIGDRPHGCNKQNKLWLDNFQLKTMMLHAKEIKFTHPHTQKSIVIQAEISTEFKRVLAILKNG